VHKNGRRWDLVAKLFEGVSAEDCRTRWDILRSHRGLEYKAFAFREDPEGAEAQPGVLASPSKGKSKPKDNHTVVQICSYIETSSCQHQGRYTPIAFVILLFYRKVRRLRCRSLGNLMRHPILSFMSAMKQTMSIGILLAIKIC
jgi:hypothetical protein